MLIIVIKLKIQIYYSQLSFIRTSRDFNFLVRNKFYEYSNIRILKKILKNTHSNIIWLFVKDCSKIVVNYTKVLRC